MTQNEALDEAASNAGFDHYRHAVKCTTRARFILKSIEGDAEILLRAAKHEKPPVDPDLEKARELVKEYQGSGPLKSGGMWILERDAERAILAAIKWARSNAKEPIQ